MPKTVLGQPLNEAKWARAKKRAAEEGHEEDWDYIMSIYKRMAHLEKSNIDSRSQRGYTKDTKLKLVIHADDFDNFKCGECQALLFRGLSLEKSFIEVRCRRCGTLNIT